MLYPLYPLYSCMCIMCRGYYISSTFTHLTFTYNDRLYASFSFTKTTITFILCIDYQHLIILFSLINVTIYLISF